MSAPWLERAGGPDPADVARRAAFWRAREAGLTGTPLAALLEGSSDARPAEVHGWVERHLPLEAVARDAHALIRAWFGPALDAQGVELEAGTLGRARSWLEARDWLPRLEGRALAWPSQLLAPLGAAERACALAFALFDPRPFGSGLGRYPARLAALAAQRLDGAPLRVWDAGCATGEGTWELAAALARAHSERPVEALGTTPWPLELLMARRGERPHDPARSAALARFVAELSQAAPGRVTVRFERGDLARDPAPGAFELVACHGVVGGALEGEDAARALETLATAVAPGGLLSLTDRFRADRAAAAAAQARALAQRRGFVAIEPGVYRAPA